VNRSELEKVIMTRPLEAGFRTALVALVEAIDLYCQCGGTGVIHPEGGELRRPCKIHAALTDLGDSYYLDQGGA